MNKRFLIIGALLAGTAVLLGAFGAHGLKNVLSEDDLRIFHTAVEYQFYHSLALLITGLLGANLHSALIKWSGNLFVAGILLFSGSLYCLALLPSISFVGMVTPLGGLCFIIGWVTLAAAAWKK